VKPVVWLSIFAIVLAARGSAQPQIAANGVLNAASNALVGWPNSSIAQGSIFSIYGSNLGPSSSPALAYPLKTTLGGVSVQISSGGSTFNAIPIFVGPTQINAILPGSTPAGTATLTVDYTGQTSNLVSFQVIASSFGIFGANSTGTGVGIITGTNYQLYSLKSPANPGNVATIWGTGIGASPGDDGTAPPKQVDMPNLSLSVYVGTQAAAVLYRGRGGFTGEDQINFVVPAGITGCYVPVAVEIGNIVSNFVTMPIAPAGQSCPDPVPPIPPLGPNSPGNMTPTGNITLIRTTTIGTTASTTDYGMAFFGDPQINAFPYVPPVFANPYSLPVGTCIGSVTFPPLIDVLASPLDPGSITINGPNGSQQLSADGFAAQLGGGTGADAQPLYLSAGTYTASGTGGTNNIPVANVGPFSQNFTIPQPLTWTNEGDISLVDRSKGLDVTWTGGDPEGTVQITGYIGFICNAKTSDQHFTIPAFVLRSYPSSGTSTGNFTLSTTSTTAFTASGINSGTIDSVVLFVKGVTYQ
jgi:uncharacterized protein (TIGR03437 family)